MSSRTWHSCIGEGIGLYKQTRYRDAETAFVEGVRRARDEQATPLQLSEALCNLSVAYSALAKSSDAENVLREALALVKDTSSANHRLQRALCLNARAFFYLDEESFAEAEAMLLEAVQLTEEDHPGYAADMLSNLLRIYSQVANLRSKGDLVVDRWVELRAREQPKSYCDDFCSWLRPAVAWDEPPTTFDARELKARELLSRATLARESGPKAKALFDEVLALAADLPGLRKTVAASALISRAQLSFIDGDWPGAAKASTQALKLVTEALGETHPALYPYIAKHASYALMVEGFGPCEKYFARSLDLVKNSLGERHPSFWRCRLNQSMLLGYLCGNSADLAKQQESAILEAMDRLRDYYPDHHSTLVHGKMHLSLVYMRTQRLQEADQILQESLVLARQSAMADELVFQCLERLMTLRTSQSRFDEVKTYAAEAEQSIDDQAYRGSDWRINALMAIADRLSQLNYNDEVERLLRKARDSATDFVQVQKCDEKLAEHYLKVGQPDKAGALLVSDGALDNRHALMRESKRAAALYGEGKLVEGEQLAMTTFQRAQELPDCEDPLLHSIGVLVDIYLKTERLDEAHRFVSLMVDKKNLVVAQGVIPYCIRLIADGYARQRSVKAIALYEEAIACAEQVQGRNPELLDQCLSSYGEYCFANGLKEKAYRNSERLLDFRKSVYGRNSAHYAIALAIRARLALGTDFVQADESSKEALEIIENLAEENEHCLKIALETRCLVLKKMQRLDEHKEMEKRLDDLRNQAPS